MINLLPHDLKEDYRYARRNRHLLSWLAGVVLAIIGVGIITGVGLLLMNHSATTYTTHIAAEKNQLANEKSDEIQQQITTMSSNITLMVKVLSQEILFSKLLDRLGQVTPNGVVLSGLSIAPTKNSLTITAGVTNYSAATQFLANVSDSGNQIFSKADLVSVDCSSSAPNPKYPCTMTVQALLSANSQFLFINADGKAKS